MRFLNVEHKNRLMVLIQRDGIHPKDKKGFLFSISSQVMIRELNAMGNNLNQLTVMLRMGYIHNPNLKVIKNQFTKFIEQAESALEGR